MLPLFQSPLNILCEICDIKNRWPLDFISGNRWPTFFRGYVICFACLTWSLGQIAFPLVGENHFAVLHHNLAKLISLWQIQLYDPRLADCFLEVDQDCLRCSSRLPSLLLEDAPGVSALAHLQVTDEGGFEDPDQDCRDERSETSRRSYDETGKDCGG